ncbi:MAG: PAS domain S-box protein [Trueperaceae bacterium]|nr:PAS domain S-box protein [Trueperaceae bacterium]
MTQSPKSTALPSNDATGSEAARLAALYRYRILDTPPEVAFDRVVRLAARELGAPSAFLSFVDSERLWFKANYNWGARESKREASFCNTVVSCDDVFVVNDARQDERFADHPAVTGALNIRFYVGVPLRTHDNQVIGALSVIDTEPRSDISDDKRATLEDLAAIVVDELELRLLASDLRHEVTARRQAGSALAGNDLAGNDPADRTPHAVATDIDEIVYTKDHERRYTFVNQAFCDTFDLVSEDVIGRRNDELPLRAVAALSDHYDDEVIRQGRAKSYEVTLSLAGRNKTFRVSKVPQGSSPDTPRGVVGIARDITRQKQNEVRLQLLESVVVNAKDAILVTEAEPQQGVAPRILYVNPAFSAQTGYSAAETIGQTPELFLGDQSDLRVLSGARQKLGAGESVQAELVQYTKTGTAYWTEMSITPVADGGHGHWVAVQRDVSERKEAEARLEHYTRRLDDILESITDAFFALDHDWRFTYVNQEAETVLGRTRGELLGASIWDAFPGVVGSVFEEKYRQAVREGRSLTFTSFYPPLDKWFEVSAYPSDEGLSVFFDDVTERRRYERELKERNDTLRSFYDSAAVMMGTVELSDDDIVHITDNAATHAFFRTDAETMEGRSARELGVPEEHIEAWLEAYRQSLATNQPIRFEYEHRWPNEHRWLSATVNHIGPGPTGRPRCSYVVNDVTDRKAALDALQRAKDEAERANQAKSDFLSRMSHELRTPLTAILGFSQLLQLSDLSEEDADNVDDVYKAGQHLLELINEVLDIARIESGRMSLSVETVRLREVLKESLELVRPLGDERDIRFDIALDQQPDLYVMADHQRLKQVVLNLLSNAIKYNRHGGTVSLTVASTPSGTARVGIHDTGPGISPDKQAQLFEAFERLGVEQSGIEGSGLGLALSKNLVELMGGTVTVDSVVDEGSTFWVTLPLSEAGTPRADEVLTEPDLDTPVDDTTHRVLYIEDNLSNLKLVTRILAQRPEIELMSAMQGSLGVTLARQHRPDVVLLDLHLPDISGEDVLRELRTHHATADIPVVVISADATPRQIDRLTAQGAYAYLTKPIDVARLLQTLRELLETDDANGDTSDGANDGANDGTNEGS